MARNSNLRGNASRIRTRKYLEETGWKVSYLERQYRVVAKSGRVISVKQDIWGGDLVATDGKRVRWIQVKSNEGDISTGLKELAKCPLPDWIEKEVWLWRLRAREPEIISLRTEGQKHGTTRQARQGPEEVHPRQDSP